MNIFFMKTDRVQRLHSAGHGAVPPCFKIRKVGSALPGRAGIPKWTYRRTGCGVPPGVVASLPQNGTGIVRLSNRRSVQIRVIVGYIFGGEFIRADLSRQYYSIYLTSYQF